MTDKGLLLHACCAPCLSGARIGLQDNGVPFKVFWFNPNIQPLTEHERRLATFLDYQGADDFGIHRIDLDGRGPYADMISMYLRTGSVPLTDGLEVESRCDLCYLMRLRRSAEAAKEAGFSSFTTTLLLSKYQRHDRVRAVGEIVGEELGIEFLYMDLRKYWGRSLDASRRHRLYRQRYCGCELSLEGRSGPSGSGMTSEPSDRKPEVRIKPCNEYKAEHDEG